MLTRLKEWLETPAPAEPQDPIELQALALLVELARADHEFELAERNIIRTLASRSLKLPADAIDDLISRAESMLDRSVSLHPMTSRIHAEYNDEQKRALLMQLWQVALADGEIDAHEEHLIRKLAGLLHLPRAAFAQTREAAKAWLDAS